MKPARILRLAAQLKLWASEREEQRDWPVSVDELVARVDFGAGTLNGAALARMGQA